MVIFRTLLHGICLPSNIDQTSFVNREGEN